MTSKILILDFGSQFTQLIARCVREANIYCEIIYVPCSCAGGKRSIVVGTTHIIRIVRSYLLSTC
ncbi:MAG TPA: hypothetical protein PKZ66_08450 [Chitinophagaceae bacterium]|nr:hypothetical protein [Chitinophagaceae bacterium]